MKMRRIGFLIVAVFKYLPVLAGAQSLADSRESSAAIAAMTSMQPALSYTRPTQKTKLRNYVFDAFGPYPIAGAAFAAGIGQAYNTPPEWKQGAEGYGKRFGSAFGIAAVSTTTRYGLAQAFKEDTLYYRCECKGVFPRLAPCRDFDLDSTPGRGWPPCFFFSRAHCAVCRDHDRRLCVVSRQLQRQGRTPNGQLHHAGICGREHRHGISLPRTALLASSHAP